MSQRCLVVLILMLWSTTGFASQKLSELLQDVQGVLKEAKTPAVSASVAQAPAPAQVLSAAEPLIEALDAAGTEGESTRYEFAKQLITSGSYGLAQEQLLLLREVKDPELRVSSLNANAYAQIRQQHYESALDWSRLAYGDPEFGQVSQATKRKVLNNLGVSNLILARFREAADWFAMAVALGSELAVGGLERATSALAALESGDPNLPGPYITIVASDRQADALAEKVARLDSSLQSQISTYLSDEQRLHAVVTRGASYLRAQESAAAVREQVPDVYVSSAAGWRLIKEQGTPSADEVAAAITAQVNAAQGGVSKKADSAANDSSG